MIMAELVCVHAHFSSYLFDKFGEAKVVTFLLYPLQFNLVRLCCGRHLQELEVGFSVGFQSGIND